MALPTALESIAGAQELFDWFGYWPDFHDAEILKFHVDSGAPSSLVIHTWEMTSQVDPQGYYQRAKHVVVEFVIEGVSILNLQDLWDHSILLELLIEKGEPGFKLDLSAAYGLSGTIEAEKLSVRIVPGQPSEPTLLS